MKRILFLIFTPRYSGAEIVIKNLIQNNDQIINHALIGNRFKYLISQNDIKTKFIEKLERGSVSFLFYTLKVFYFSLGITFTIIRYHRKHKFDIILANNLTLATYGVIANIIFHLIYPKTKFIWYDHNLNYPFDKRDRIAEKICNFLYSKTFVVSRAVYNKTKRKNNETFVLHNGIDISLFKNDLSIGKQMKKKFSLQNKIVIGIFGIISDNKGQINLLKSIQIITNHNSLIHLVIIGDYVTNKIEKKLNKTIRKLNLRNVIILQSVKNINVYYNLIDILVNNTSSQLSESLGTTILEGMSSEKIVIASNTGGAREIIRDGIDGFLFEPDSVKELKNKIKYVINNFENLHQIKKNARQRIVQKFTIKKMVTSFNKIIEQI